MIETPENIISQAQALAGRAMFRRAAVLLRVVISDQGASETARSRALHLAEGLADKAARHRQTIEAARERRQREQARAAALRLEAALARAAAAPRGERPRFNGTVTTVTPNQTRQPSAERIAALNAQAERQRAYKQYLQDVQRLTLAGVSSANIARQLGKSVRTVRYTLQQMRKAKA
ncbi:hypothetical protein DOC35_19410 [Salmonella enterica subsp. enterica]|nr:hypothetical protein [Salmonella enterica subsp. enterica]